MTKSIRKTIDQYASIALQIRELQDQLESLRPSILALGEGPHAGKEHEVNVIHQIRASLSTTLAKSVLTPAEIAACTVVSDVTTVRINK